MFFPRRLTLRDLFLRNVRNSLSAYYESSMELSDDGVFSLFLVFRLLIFEGGCAVAVTLMMQSSFVCKDRYKVGSVLWFATLYLKVLESQYSFVSSV